MRVGRGKANYALACSARGLAHKCYNTYASGVSLEARVRENVDLGEVRRDGLSGVCALVCFYNLCKGVSARVGRKLNALRAPN